jgi:transglutaminase-like putative cysteine protease
MRYRVSHTTEYRYSAQVINGHTVAHLRPRHTPTQSVISSEVTTSPPADHADEYLDAFGNHVSYRAVEQVHDQLVVTGLYEVDLTTPEQLLWSPPWEELRGIVSTDGSADGLLARMCSIESTFVTPSADLARFASWSFLPGRPFHDAVIDLSHRIYTEFAFDPGFSDVSTPLTDVLTHRRGVCQDFAHLALACLRSHGVPARYVSGYLETTPPAGKPRLVGADASHAWIAVFCGEAGWIAIDPTNDQLAGPRHITLCWGRDYGDVGPVKGVILGGGPHTVAVAVDVEAM